MPEIIFQEKYREAATAPPEPPPEPTPGSAPEDSTAFTFPPAHGYLNLVCPKCTRQGQFIAATEHIAKMMTKAAGWKLTPFGIVCKKCPG